MGDLGWMMKLGEHRLVYSQEEFVEEVKKLDDGFRVVMNYVDYYIENGLYTFPAMMSWNKGQIYLENIDDFLLNFIPKVEDRGKYSYMTDKFCEYVLEIKELFDK